MLANAQPHTNVNCFLWRWQKKNKLHTNIFGGKIKLHTLQMQTVSFAQIYLIRFRQMKEILLMSSIMHKYAQICYPQVSHIPMHNFLYFQAFHHQGRFFSIIFFCFILCSKSAIVCPCHSSFPAQNYNFACSCQGGDKSIGSGKKSEFSCCTNTFFLPRNTMRKIARGCQRKITSCTCGMSQTNYHHHHCLDYNHNYHF